MLSLPEAAIGAEENLASPSGFPSGPSTCTSTRPCASLQASSTASAMRLWADSFNVTRSTTTSMKCLIFLFRVTGSPESFTIAVDAHAGEALLLQIGEAWSPRRPTTTGP